MCVFKLAANAIGSLHFKDIKQSLMVIVREFKVARTSTIVASANLD